MTEDEEISATAIPQTDSDTTCPICYAEFLEPEDLRVHANQVHAIVGTRLCHFCVHIFASLDDYARHILDTHIINLTCCKYCKKVFLDVDALKEHEKIHCTRGRKDVFSCSQCYYVCQTIYDLEKHEFDNHNNNKDGVFLNDCFPHLSSYLNVKASMFLQSLGTNATYYVCACCNFTTSSVLKYVNHLSVKQCRSITCNNCSNVYNKRKQLVRHLRSKIDCSRDLTKEMLKACPKCYKDIDHFAYSEHVKTCNPYKCNHCNKILKSMYELTEHQSKEHPMAILMTRCHFCQKDYIGNDRLQKHIEKMHKPELHLYKYKCIFCDKLYFKHPQIMFRHFFSKHPQIKPYCCKICDKTFRVRKSFTVHIKLFHNSVGFVEFDERYHVFFSDKKSEKPFQPKCLFANEIQKYKELESTQKKPEETNNQTDMETEAPTDAEEAPKTDSQRKPLKIRYKEQKKSKEISNKSLNLQSDLSDDNRTELLIPRKSFRKRKQLTKKKVIKTGKGSKDDSDMSEDEPLSKLRKRDATNFNEKRQSWIYKKNVLKNKRRFECDICNRNCYTFQNYNHHMSLHSEGEIKKCIKCSQTFTSKAALNKHTSEVHATSKLTETLKSLLQRRKLGINGVQDLTTPEKFRKTIKKVKIDNDDTATVTVKEVNDMSVQKFIENFTPEETGDKTKKTFDINAIVTVKAMKQVDYVPKKPMIKMTKFNPKPAPSTIKLAMPVRFKKGSTEKPKVNVKLIQTPIDLPIDDANDLCNDGDVDHLHYDDGDKSTVPEVAEEVMLEEAPQETKRTQYKIVIPKLPADYSTKDISIAHMLPEAPFYRIVKMKEMMKGASDKDQTPAKNLPNSDDVAKQISSKLTLPCGTKLVSVNPLAHLIGDKPVDEIVGTRKRYYKPKTANFQEAIVKALSKLEDSTRSQSAKKRKKELVEATIQEVEQ